MTRTTALAIGTTALGIIALGIALAACGSSSTTAHRSAPAAGAESDMAYAVTDAPMESIAAPATSSLSAPGQAPPRRRGFAGGPPSADPGGQGGQGARPRFTLGPGEELWVITRPASWTTPAAADPHAPRCGTLYTTVEGVEHTVPVPLAHTDVRASVTGYISSVQVTQQFHNPYSSKIEAVYVFPLPQNAAVQGFLMTIGDRTIRGVVREKEEAEQLYAEARARGHHAAIMTQQRPNIFTQKVANIEPGTRIDVDVTYFGTLRYDDDAYEFVFPMVVGPRYNPAGSADPILASPRGATAPAGTTNVPYLRPGERSGHDIALRVDIDAGVPIEGVTCRSHVVDVRRYDAQRVTVQLAASDSIPNKDFVLRYEVAGSDVRSGILTHADERGGYFSVMLVPPARLESLERQPVEMVFVLDCSGSMRGRPMAQSKAAMRRAIRRLRDDDSFQIIRFSQNASTFGPAPVPATAENRRKAERYVEKLSGSGGTEMLEGIRTALEFAHDETRVRVVCFLTDGYIGNESQILAELHRRLGALRIFAFGVGSSPNRYLMDRMAMLGRGAVAYLGLEDSGADVMDAFFDRVAHPALTDVRLDFHGADVFDVYPRASRDLLVGRPVIVTGRVRGALPSSIGVVGSLGGENVTFAVPVAAAATPNPALAALWARTKIADLMDEMAWSSDRNLERTVLDVALGYQLMSRYTAFLAVDSRSRTAGTQGTSVQVPVPTPEGVRYDTTVGR